MAREIFTDSEVKRMFEQLYAEIKHGDEEHQIWLREKIKSFAEIRLPLAKYQFNFAPITKKK